MTYFVLGRAPATQPIRSEESDPCPRVHCDACHVTDLCEKCQHGTVARTMFFPTITLKGTSGFILCRTSTIRTFQSISTQGNEAYVYRLTFGKPNRRRFFLTEGQIRSKWPDFDELDTCFWECCSRVVQNPLFLSPVCWSMCAGLFSCPADALLWNTCLVPRVCAVGEHCCSVDASFLL